MIAFEEIEHKLIALVIWNIDNKSDVHVYAGQIMKREKGLVFVDEEKGWTVTIHAEQFARLKKVPDNLKASLLHADYVINLTIADMVNNEGTVTPPGMK